MAYVGVLPPSRSDQLEHGAGGNLTGRLIEVTCADESVSANFPGIQLERESVVDTSAAVEAVLPPSAEEEAQAAAQNSGVVNQANTPIPGVSSAVVEEIEEDDDANTNVGLSCIAKSLS